MASRTNEFTLIIKHDDEDVEAAELFVDGTIGGRLYRFRLDTGAARSSVMFDDYTSGFGSDGTSTSSGVFANSSGDLIIVPNIDIGPIVKYNFTLVRAAGRDPGISNLIGMDLLKDFRCHFLFDENRVLIDANDDLDAGYGFQELLLDNTFHPYVDVRCGASNAKAVWDTGASITIVDSTFIEREPASFQEDGSTSGTDSTGVKMKTRMFIMAAAVIGDHVFPPHRVAAVDLSHVNSTIQVPMDLILGYTTLSKANWVFDFARQRWALSKQLGVS